MRYLRKKNKGWTVKNQRPEELLGDPSLYYTEDEIERYARSSTMKKVQHKIAMRILQILNLKKKSLILDLGSGPGLTAEVYRDDGHIVVCLDVLEKMLNKAKEKGFECVKGDMRDLINLFPNRKFDAIVSASAIQWLKNEEDIESLAKGIFHIMKNDACCIIQFYPKTEQELKVFAYMFKKMGFSAEIIIDQPDNPKKRTIFLVLKK